MQNIRKFCRFVIVLALVGAWMASGQARAQTATETAVPATPTAVPVNAPTQPLPTSGGEEEQAVSAETDQTPIRLPDTGGNLLVLALAGLTAVEAGIGLHLLAKRRRR